MKTKERVVIALIILFIMCLVTLSTWAQTVIKRNEKGVFKSVSVRDSGENLQTGEKYEDSKGNIYPIFKNSGGKFYVIRTSKKTGKDYKQYLKIN